MLQHALITTGTFEWQMHALGVILDFEAKFQAPGTFPQGFLIRYVIRTPELTKWICVWPPTQVFRTEMEMEMEETHFFM